MKKSVLFLAAVSVALLCHCPSAGAQVYKLDDGTAEDAFAFGNTTTNSGSIWLNSFPVTAGFNRITSVSIAWGSPGGSSENVNGRPMQALLYNDPNGDGSPLDSTLLASATGTIQNVGTNTFITYTFSSPITIGTTNFFVGYYVPGFTPVEGVRQYFAGIDESSGSLPSRSFIYGNADGSEPSLTSLASNTFGSANSALGIPGNWLVRANAVPEPSTWAMVLAAGVGTLAVVRSRRRQAQG